MQVLTEEQVIKEFKDYDIWATQAVGQDKYGSAWQFELMALLLRYYAASMDTQEKVT